MTMRRNGLKEDVKRVVAEIMKTIDFDMEALCEAAPEEIQAVIFDAVLSVMDPDEVPFIDWIRMVEDMEVEEMTNEKGDFIPN